MITVFQNPNHLRLHKRWEKYFVIIIWEIQTKNQIKNLDINRTEDIYKYEKKITLGILAHVDSGKTTLSEAFFICNRKNKKVRPCGP